MLLAGLGTETSDKAREVSWEGGPSTCEDHIRSGVDIRGDKHEAADSIHQVEVAGRLDDGHAQDEVGSQDSEAGIQLLRDELESK